MCVKEEGEINLFKTTQRLVVFCVGFIPWACLQGTLSQVGRTRVPGGFRFVPNSEALLQKSPGFLK